MKMYCLIAFSFEKYLDYLKFLFEYSLFNILLNQILSLTIQIIVGLLLKFL